MDAMIKEAREKYEEENIRIAEQVFSYFSSCLVIHWDFLSENNE